MEENRDKQLDDFIKKVVNNAGLEAPSDDFTQSIMSKIAAQNEKSMVTRYKPLISRTSWLVLAGIAIFLSVYIIFGNSDLNVSWIPSITELATHNIGIMNTLENLQLPNTLVYGLAGLTFFIYVQIVLLKKHLESRYTLN
ncbi:hypothetical protein [uncultured Eudoraea sp.]|uniref:hypothetical protein n=1 Tax=uncultured Eudoraea sp. TaxID=1035614 RepID=UPI002633D622|nr:hypothetical protein [uncultured Eudoraea sp.]